MMLSVSGFRRVPALIPSANSKRGEKLREHVQRARDLNHAAGLCGRVICSSYLYAHPDFVPLDMHFSRSVFSNLNFDKIGPFPWTDSDATGEEKVFQVHDFAALVRGCAVTTEDISPDGNPCAEWYVKRDACWRSGRYHRPEDDDDIAFFWCKNTKQDLYKGRIIFASVYEKLLEQSIEFTQLATLHCDGFNLNLVSQAQTYLHPVETSHDIYERFYTPENLGFEILVAGALTGIRPWHNIPASFRSSRLPVCDFKNGLEDRGRMPLPCNVDVRDYLVDIIDTNEGPGAGDSVSDYDEDEDGLDECHLDMDEILMEDLLSVDDSNFVESI